MEDAKNRALTTNGICSNLMDAKDSMPKKIPAVNDMGGQLKFQSVQYNELWSNWPYFYACLMDELF